MSEIVYSRSALKSLRRMPANDAKRITSKIRQYRLNPESLANNVTELKGSNYRRLRVGDWRIIMDDTGAVLEVLKIGPRGSIYD